VIGNLIFQFYLFEGAGLGMGEAIFKKERASFAHPFE
jgi:hypothetical protein